MYHIRRGKGSETNTYWMPTVYLEPHTQDLTSSTKHTCKIGIMAPIWEMRKLKTEKLYECVQNLGQNSNTGLLLCSFPHSTPPRFRRPWQTMCTWVWYPGVQEVSDSNPTPPPTTQYLLCGIGKSLHLELVSLFRNWGMVSGHLPRLWSQMI